MGTQSFTVKNKDMICLLMQIRESSWLPSYLFGMISLACVFLTRFLPETLGRGLLTSIEQVVGYPLNLTKEERQQVQDAHRRESWFGKINEGCKDDVGKAIIHAADAIESKRF